MSAILDLDACINQNLAAIVPRRNLYARYLLNLLTASYDSFREFGRGGNQEALDCEIVGQFRIAVPPINEQKAIASFIEKHSARLNSLNDAYARQLALLAEYRAALIHECVTGQRRVGDTTNGETP